MKLLSALLTGMVLLCAATPLLAWQGQAHVTWLDASNVGGTSGAAGYPAIYFQLDVAVDPTCPTTAYHFWSPKNFGTVPPDATETAKQLANTRAILSTLQLAMFTGTKVWVYGLNGYVANGNTYCQSTSIMSLPTP